MTQLTLEITATLTDSDGNCIEERKTYTVSGKENIVIGVKTGVSEDEDGNVHPDSLRLTDDLFSGDIEDDVEDEDGD